MNSKQKRILRRKDKRAGEKPDTEEVVNGEMTLEQLAELAVDDDEAAEEEAAEKVSKEVEVKEKSFGATSFEEMDAERANRVQMQKVQQVLYDAEQISSNIFYDSDLDAKAKTSKLKSLADSFEKRISGVIVKAFDYDLAELEMLMRQGDIPILEKATDIFERVKLTTAARNELPDSAFALVVERDGVKAREFPIHDAPHVRHSLAQAAQQIKSGESADARAALGNIRAAAKKIGIGAPSKKNLNGIVVLKDKEGNYRWFGWYSNNFKDRDSEIITEEAHKEYMAWLDEHPQFAPSFRVWHTPGTDRQKQADWWDYSNGFAMMSGPLNSDEAEKLMTVAAKHRLGMSHGFYGIVKDKNEITWYRSFEVSDLPLDQAANSGTSLDVLMKEKDMNANKKAYLAEQLGEDFANSVETDAAQKQAQLRDEGIVEKDASEDAPIETPTTPDVPEVPEAQVATVMKAVADQLGLKDLSDWVVRANKALEKVDVLEKQFAQLSKSEDEKIAERITPPVARTQFAWMKAASKSDENVIESDDEDQEVEVKVKDDANWLSEVGAIQSPGVTN